MAGIAKTNYSTFYKRLEKSEKSLKRSIRPFLKKKISVFFDQRVSLADFVFYQ